MFLIFFLFLFFSRLFGFVFEPVNAMGLLVQTAKNYLCTCGSLIRVYYYNYAHGCVFAHALVVFLTSVV